MAPGELSTVLAVQTVGQMLAKFTFSWMMDRLSVRVVLLSAITVQILALGTFSAALMYEAQMLAVLGAGLQAAALGGAYSVDGVSYAKYFGRDALGSITGVTKACWQVATAVGPTPLGLVRDYTGSFQGALIGAALLCMVGFGMVFVFGKSPSVGEPRMLCCFKLGYDKLFADEEESDDHDEDEERPSSAKKRTGKEGVRGSERASLLDSGDTGSDEEMSPPVDKTAMRRLREENADLKSKLAQYEGEISQDRPTKESK